MESLFSIYIAQGGTTMTTKQKKLTLLIIGFLVHASAQMIKVMQLIDSRFLFLCLTLLRA